MEELTFKKVLTYLLLYVILPFSIFNSIGGYFTDHPEILESTIKIANQENTTLSLLIIGIISGTLGALGHLIGKILEDIISSRDSFIKRFPNDFFRVFFWVTTTIYLYISLIYSNEFTLGSVAKYSLLIGSITALICGLIYPILNKIFFNSYIATNQKNMMLESFIWFLRAVPQFSDS